MTVDDRATEEQALLWKFDKRKQVRYCVFLHFFIHLRVLAASVYVKYILGSLEKSHETAF